MSGFSVLRRSSVDISQVEVIARTESRDDAERYVGENTVDGVNVNWDHECDYLEVSET